MTRTPDDRPWAGAYWGNHNSRDNFPDIAFGMLASTVLVLIVIPCVYAILGDFGLLAAPSGSEPAST